MKILFARHGESEANLLHEFSNHGLKHPLTQLGRQQAVDLASKLENRALTRIYSSPVLRAIETTIIIANRLGIEYEITSALRECEVGLLEGRADEESWRQWHNLFEQWVKDQDRELRIDGGESFYDVETRFLPFVDHLLSQYQGTQANLLCVGHGALYWMMLPVILKNIDYEFINQKGLGYTTLVLSEPGPDGLICTEWNLEVIFSQNKK